MSEKITIPVEFEIGNLTEVGMSLQLSWVDSEHEGVNYSLTCGAGLGNPFLRGSATREGEGIYARTDISELARALFDELKGRLAAQEEEES